MIRHYLTISRQAAVLEEHLVDRTLAECWSQQKNELFLRFIDGRDSVFVEISLDLRIGYALLRNDARRARRNTIDFFQAALGAHATGVQIDDGERVIRIRMSNGLVLVVFLFGPGSGNAMLLRDGAVIESFHKDAGAYADILSGTAEPRQHTRAEIARSLADADAPAAKALARALPELGRRLAEEAFFRSAIDGDRPAASLSPAEITALLDSVDRLYSECDAGDEIFLYHTTDELIFALTELRSLAARSQQVQRFGDIAEAIRVFRSTWYRTQSIETLRASVVRALSTERARLERLLEKQRASALHATRAEEYEKSGSLLTANLHAVERGTRTITLQDYDGGARSLTLDPTLTPAQNADRLFARARKAREAGARAEGQQRVTIRRLREIDALLEAARAATTVGELEELVRNNRETVRMEREPREVGSADRFRRFEVAGGLEVFAGKSAANNDELTVRFAKPNDYWFHARGTSGSHVILRWGDSKSKPPKEAIRAAASIAAYYSGAKNAKMVPVAYAVKKHVRKPRGAGAGSVVMEREEVIMVEPRLPEGE